MNVNHLSLSGLYHPLPVCAACHLGKMAQLSSKTCHLGNPDATVKAHIHGQILPGSCVSIDQYISGVPGHLPHTQGKEPATSWFHHGTLFADHASSIVVNGNLNNMLCSLGSRLLVTMPTMLPSLALYSWMNSMPVSKPSVSWAWALTTKMVMLSMPFR